MDSIERKYVKKRLAIVLVTSLLFTLMYICGMQDHVSVLAGAHSGSGWEQMLGFLYVILYLMMISIIPILFISIPFLFLPRLWTTSSSSELD